MGVLPACSQSVVLPCLKFFVIKKCWKKLEIKEKISVVLTEN